MLITEDGLLFSAARAHLFSRRGAWFLNPSPYVISKSNSGLFNISFRRTTLFFRINWQKRREQFHHAILVVWRRWCAPPLRPVGSGWNNLGVSQFRGRRVKSERGWAVRRRRISDRWWEHGGDRSLALRLPGSAHRGQQRRRLQTRTANARVRKSVKHDTCIYTIVSF